MEQINSYDELMEKIKARERSFLMLYKTGSELSECAVGNLKSAINGDHQELGLFAADVLHVRDIHEKFSISTVPSLLVFEKESYVNVIKGCHDSGFYKALAENALFYAQTQKEGKTLKNVTVYSTPTCSWCNTLKSWLRKNRIPFTDVDVSRDEKAAQAMTQRSGQQGVPQTDINGQIVVGFDQARLKELLEIA
jgi:glutaredoxin-like YruB-family protein